MLTVAKLFDALGGLPPETRVIVGIIEGGRYNALAAHHEDDLEGRLLYILCERRERPWHGAPPPAHEPVADRPASVVPIKDACPKCGDRSALRLVDPGTGQVECLACGHKFRPGGGPGPATPGA